VYLKCRHCIFVVNVRVATNLENLQKGNLTMVREKSGTEKSHGKCILPVVCNRDFDGHRISIA